MDAVSRGPLGLGLSVVGESWVTLRDSVPAPGACESRFTGLLKVIEAEIIPRLMVVHGSPTASPAVPCGTSWVSLPGAVGEFTEMVLGPDADAAMACAQRLQEQGASLESICLELLAPTARHLGQLWESDERNIAEVTLGLLRLHAVLRALGLADPVEGSHDKPAQRALLVPAPGEDHRLGVAMVGEFFRRAGWDVEGDVPDTLEELRTVVSRDWYDVVGLSVSCVSRLELLAESVRVVRASSRNRRVVVLVGGHLFAKRPEMGSAVGADLTVVDGLLAPTQASDLIARRGRLERA